MSDPLSSNGMLQAMNASMTLASRRMALIAANLANLDTPGYRTQDFSFQGALRQALGGEPGQFMPMSRTHPRHLQDGLEAALPPAEEPIRPAYERNDGNDVNLDRETMLLSRTQSAYQLSAQFAQVELRKLLQAIREGGR